MVIGICQLTFHLPGNRSLKGKRQIVRRMCERVRNRFHCSIAEVDDLDRHQQARLGIALVGNDTRVLQSVMEQIQQTLEQMQLAPLLEREQEFLQYNSSFGMDRPLFDLDDDDEYDTDSGEYDAPWSKGTTSTLGDEDAAQGEQQPPGKAPNAWAYLDEWED